MTKYLLLFLLLPLIGCVDYPQGLPHTRFCRYAWRKSASDPALRTMLIRYVGYNNLVAALDCGVPKFDSDEYRKAMDGMLDWEQQIAEYFDPEEWRGVMQP